mgnify:CR=1 FL=1|jgi:hypothetical protein
MSVYVVEEGEDIARVAYRTFDQVKAYITARAEENGWEINDDHDAPEPDFEEDNANRYRAGRARPAERPVGKTFIWGRGDEGEVHIIIHKLTLEDDLEDPVGPDGGRRKQRLAVAKKKCSPGYEVYDYRKNAKGEFFNCAPAGLKRRKTRRRT